MATSIQNAFNKSNEHFQVEVKKIGKVKFLEKVRAAAKTEIPNVRRIRNLDPVSRSYLEKVTELLNTGSKLPDTDDPADDLAIARFAQEVAWAKLTTDILKIAVISKDNSPFPTHATQCSNNYQQCLDENSCDGSQWFCLCCVPCSIDYIKCMATHVVGQGGIHSTVDLTEIGNVEQRPRP